MLLQDITAINLELIDLQAQFSVLHKRISDLQRTKREIESQEFIRVNRITRDQVEHRDHQGGKNWFGTAWDFAQFLKNKGSTKPWVDWNGLIYHSSDFLRGYMPEDTRGYSEHLPE